MFHETLNLATLWKLPVVFVVENNGYAMGTSVARTASHEEIWKLGLGYEMPCGPVDGMDPVAVAEAMAKAIKLARDGGGPSFLEMKTYRYRGHSMSDAQQYRTKDEVVEYRKIDPIIQVKDVIVKKKYATQSQLDKIDVSLSSIVLVSAEYLNESPYPDKSLMYDAVYEQKEVALMPEDAELITMPRLSDTMEEGTVASWLKKVGDEVKEGDILAEIETDKATMEFESFYEGTLLYIGVNEGETAPVDSLLAIIGEKDENISKYIDEFSSLFTF